jgi:hypothetical protein
LRRASIPAQCQTPTGCELHSRAKSARLPIQRSQQPIDIRARRRHQLKASDLEGRHFERGNFSGCRVDIREIHQRNIVAELLVASNALVVVQEITASIKNEPVPIDLDGLGVMGGMAVTRAPAGHGRSASAPREPRIPSLIPSARIQ